MLYFYFLIVTAFFKVHTFRFTGHSPADPEHERGRKDEKKWARAEADPIKIFEDSVSNFHVLSHLLLNYICKLQAIASKLATAEELEVNPF